MIFPEDIQYERWLETGQINTIGDISLEEWPLDENDAYDISDPKHPTYHERYSDISDVYDYDF